MRRRLSNQGVTWLEGRCVSFGRHVPYLPIIDLLKRSFGVEETDNEAQIIERLQRHTAAWDAAAQTTVPYLRWLLSVDPGDPRVSQMDPRERQAGVFDTLRATLVQMAAQQPVVMVIEDAQWIDDLSRAALDVLIDAVPLGRALLVLTHRPGQQPQLSDRIDVSRLTLDHLDPVQSAELARAVLGVARLPVELQGLITGAAEGNPFYVEEVTRSLLEGGALTRDNGSFQLARPVTEVRIPGTIQEVILARIDRLECEAKRAIQLASVIGREFAFRLLDRIYDLQARLSDVLDELRTLGLIYEKARLPELAFMFKHALTHDVAYSTLLAERRRMLHRLVGAAIEEIYGDRLAEHYELLAHHYVEGKDWEKALDYLAKAGDKATAAYGYPDALGFYARALEVCERLGEQAVPASAWLAAKRGFVNLGVGDLPGSIADFDRMLAAARHLGSSHLEGTALGYRGLLQIWNNDLDGAESTLRAALAAAEDDDKEVRALGNAGLAFLFVASNRLPEAEALLITADQVAALPDAFMQGFGYTILGFFEYWRGRPDEALDVLRQVPEPALEVMTNRLFNWWCQSLALATRGEYEAALEVLQRIHVTSERVGDTLIRASVLNTIGWIHGELQDHERAREWNQTSVEMASQPGFPVPGVAMYARLNLGDNLRALGRAVEAEEQFRAVEEVVRSPRLAERLMAWRYAQHLFHSYGELWLDCNEPIRALAYADECLELAVQTSSRKNVVKGRRLRGQTLMALGRLEEAEAELNAALEGAPEVGNPPQLWRCHAALGDLREAQGRSSDGRSHYQQALAVIDQVVAGLSDERLRHGLLSSQHARGIRQGACGQAQ
jgi:tetratricopeptide (TPR) repeat protein